MKRRRWRRGTCSFPRRAAANVAAPSLASCLIRMSRCRPLFGKQGAQRLIHIRQLHRAISCTEPKRRQDRLGGSPRVPSSLVWSYEMLPSSVVAGWVVRVAALVAGWVAYVGRTSS